MDRWYHKQVHEIGWYLSMVQSVVINFSSKVYSKSLLKGSPLLCTSLEKVISCSRSIEADILESKKDLYLVPEVWRLIFRKSIVH